MAAFDEEREQQLYERLDAMSQMFAQLEGVDAAIATSDDAALAVYPSDLRVVVSGEQDPAPSTTTSGASPLSLAVPRGGSMTVTDDCSSLHTLDFGAQQEKIAGIDVHAKPATSLPIINSAVMMDDFGPSFDDFDPHDPAALSPLTVESDSDNDSGSYEKKLVVRSPVQHKPALPTPAPSDGSPYRRIPPRKTRSQTQTASRSTPGGFSATAARTPRNRLSAAPPVPSPLAQRVRSSTTRRSMSALSQPSTSRLSTLSPSPSPARAPIKLDLDNAHPLATKLKAGLGAIAARFNDNEECDFEVPAHLMHAAPIAVAPQHPAAARIKQQYVRQHRGTFGRRKKRAKMDVEPEDQIAEATVLWPALIHDTENIQTIGCDRCNVWYHWCCVGFAVDAIVDEDTPFECPPCAAEIRQGKDVDPERSRLTKRRVQHCPRLDCPLAGRRLDDDEYFCERLIGRRPSDLTPGGLQYYVKWDGYSLDDSTWEEATALPAQFRARLIKAFETQAAREGIEVGDPDDGILLNEVILNGARILAKQKAHAGKAAAG